MFARALLVALLLLTPMCLFADEPKNDAAKPSADDCENAPETLILTDLRGVDFTAYMAKLKKTIRENWVEEIPQGARYKRGCVSIEFSIARDGRVFGMRRTHPSGDIILDRAAWGGITASNPFPPLPEGFKGNYVRLGFHFLYNIRDPVQISAKPETERSSPAVVPSVSSTLAEAFALYQVGKFPAAAEKYRFVLGTDEKNSEAYAGLVQTLLKQKDIEQARVTIDKALQNADSPKVRVALGEVEYREGSLSSAERDWLNVINSDHPQARAYLGIAKVSNALSLHKRARTMIQRAYAADPNDADVRKAWISTLPRSERIKFMEAYLAQNNADDQETQTKLRQYLDYLKARLQGPKGSCHLVSKVTSTETSMISLLSDPKHLRGFGLEVTIGDRKSRLLLDTGAGGILINRRLAEKAGLKRISDTLIGGIGDKGAVGGYVVMAPSIKVGGLEFQNCPIEVMDRRTVADEEGLIGADVFEDLLVDLDFAHQKLRLQELPRRPNEPQQDFALNAESDDDTPDASGSEKSESDANKTPAGHGPFDRYVAPEMKEYSTVLRYGHMLLIPTFVEQEKQARFFLIDSGGFATQLSLTTAKAVTKVHNEEEWRVKGLNGEVNKVYNADKAILTFAHLRQPTYGALVLNLKGLSDDIGTEVGGILGFTTLRFLDIKVDYRDGLVWMDYQGPKWLVN